MAKGAIQLSIPKSELRNLEKQLKWYQGKKRSQFKDEMEDAATYAERKAIDNAPRKNGDLRQNIRSEVSTGTNEITGVIRSEQNYSAAVEYGTKPHIIRAKNKKVLANARKGQFFGKEVRHPGTAAQPFLGPAAKEAYQRMIEQIKKLFK